MNLNQLSFYDVIEREERITRDIQGKTHGMYYFLTNINEKSIIK